MTRNLQHFMLRGAILILLGLSARDAACAEPAVSRNISTAELRAHVAFLASPELQGRDAPGLGSRIAERYIAALFAEYGLSAFADAPGYYQEIPLLASRADYSRSCMIVQRAGRIWEFEPNHQIFFFPRGGTDGDITAPVLLAGYGIRAPEFAYDDFRGADPGGKFLLIFNREPQEQDSASVFNGARPTKYSNPIVKVRLAQELGARGLLIVQPPNNDLPSIEKTLEKHLADQDREILQLAEHTEAFPVVYLKPEAAEALLGTDFDLAAYQRGIDDHFQPDPRLLPDLLVTLSIRFRDVRMDSTANIVGYIPGKSDEVVVVLAHHDHIGLEGGRIHFGADDNASGTAGLLSLAKAFSAEKGKLRRGVVFLSTSAEEDGTLGALYFTRHLPVAAEKIVAAVNLDEIGRDASTQFRAMMNPEIPPEPNSLMIFYSGQSPLLADFATEANRAQKLNLILEPVLHFSGSSDHIHFHDLRIPSVFVFTGFHSDYHQPSDTADKLNYEKMTRIVGLTAEMVYHLAQSKQRVTFDPEIRNVAGTGRKYGQ
jgi:hypothetical protein